MATFKSSSPTAVPAFGGDSVTPPSDGVGYANAAISDSENRSREPLTNPYVPRGGAAAFDRKYHIQNLSYPDDINNESGRGEHGDNYVVFYINVATDSKLLKDPGVETVDDFTPNDISDIRARSLEEGDVQVNMISKSLGVPAILQGQSPFSGGFLSTGVKLGVGYTGAKLITNQVPKVDGKPKFTRSMKRLASAVTLHMPNTLNINYGVQYEETDTFGTQLGLEAGQIAVDTFKAMTAGGTPKNFNEGLERAKDVGKSVIEGVKNLGPAATNLALTAAGSGLQAATGLAPNPKKEQVFRGVDFRTFTFDYQFYPRNKKEAENVRNIIKTFKLHMHPEFKDDGNWVYLYPSEFDILYYKGTKENLNVNRHTSCVLTNMNVNYTPQGQFTTFDDGMPTQINVTLTFRELTLLTKDKIQDDL